VEEKNSSGTVINRTVVVFRKGVIDTVPGTPSKIYGRVDEYFLASMNRVYIKVNSYKRSINFGKDALRGTEFGLSGNSFVVDVDSDWIYTGINNIKAYAENMIGEYNIAKQQFYINGRFSIDSITPPIDYDFGLSREYGNGTIWTDSLNDTLHLGLQLTSGSEIEYFYMYFDDTFHIVFAETLYTTDSVIVKYKCNIRQEPQEGEHTVDIKFKIGGIDKELKTGWNLYVDNTKPYIRIIKPKSYKKYSQRVDSIMYINLETSDDSMQQYFEKSDSIVIEIDSSVENEYVNVFKYVETSGTKLYYGDWYLYKWNYRDNNGNLVPSGEYRLKAYVYDHAGNAKDTSVIFIVDNDPPKLDIDEHLSPNPFTSNVNEMIMEYRTNEHSQFNVTYIDTSNTSQERYRQFIGDSTFDWRKHSGFIPS
jgi:hypothetical protein